MDRLRTSKKRLSDGGGDNFVPGSIVYRIGLVWPLTREVVSLSKRYNVKQRLQRHITRLSGEERVEFLLVGAYAMAAHGYPRATMDIDIWVMPSAENAEAVLRALKRSAVPSMTCRRPTFRRTIRSSRSASRPGELTSSPAQAVCGLNEALARSSGGEYRNGKSRFAFSRSAT